MATLTHESIQPTSAKNPRTRNRKSVDQDRHRFAVPRWFVLIAIALSALIVLAPLFIMLLNAFKSPVDYANNGPLSIPTEFYADGLTKYWDRVDYPTKFLNSLMSSHSRLHGSSSFRVPWEYDDEAVEVMQKFSHLRYSLLPYLASQAEKTHLKGTPLMRPMVMEFPHDRATWYLEQQYMLGSDLLVAPVFRDDGVVDFYLPKGLWTNWFTGQQVNGGRWLREQHGFDSLPLYAREGSVIVTAPGLSDTQVDLSTQVLAVSVFAGKYFERLRLPIHDFTGNVVAEFEVSLSGGGIEGEAAPRSSELASQLCHPECGSKR